MVRKEGLEPSRCYPQVPETCASTNSATFAGRQMLAASGFEINGPDSIVPLRESAAEVRLREGCAVWCAIFGRKISTPAGGSPPSIRRAARLIASRTPSNPGWM